MFLLWSLAYFIADYSSSPERNSFAFYSLHEIYFRIDSIYLCIFFFITRFRLSMRSSFQQKFIYRVSRIIHTNITIMTYASVKESVSSSVKGDKNNWEMCKIKEVAHISLLINNKSRASFKD